MRKVLCIFGIHSWEYVKARPGYLACVNIRQCKECGMKQQNVGRLPWQRF
jgi:hypothetical protein